VQQGAPGRRLFPGSVAARQLRDVAAPGPRRVLSAPSYPPDPAHWEQVQLFPGRHRCHRTKARSSWNARLSRVAPAFWCHSQATEQQFVGPDGTFVTSRAWRSARCS